jgi:hypothetical protein
MIDWMVDWSEWLWWMVTVVDGGDGSGSGMKVAVAVV